MGSYRGKHGAMIAWFFLKKIDTIYQSQRLEEIALRRVKVFVLFWRANNDHSEEILKIKRPSCCFGEKCGKMTTARNKIMSEGSRFLFNMCLEKFVRAPGL